MLHLNVEPWVGFQQLKKKKDVLYKYYKKKERKERERERSGRKMFFLYTLSFYWRRFTVIRYDFWMW